MKTLSITELKNVKGGALISKLIMSLITGGSFIIGLIDGYLRPLKCRHRWVKMSWKRFMEDLLVLQ